MKIYRIIIVAAAAALCLAGCKSRFELLLASNDIDSKYVEAWNCFNSKKYKKAASMFESLALLTPGTSKDDTVRFFWAMSNYRYKDYVTAEANFNSFIESYPRSPFTSEARFLKLDCMYRGTYRYELDQTPTNLAIVAISEYIIDFPQSDRLDVCQKMLAELNERLDRKAYENATLYYKIEDYRAAKTALRNVLKDDADNMYREDVLYYIAMSSYKYANMSISSKQKERFMEFVDDYYNFISEYPESKYRKSLDQTYARSQRAMKGELTRDDIKADKKKEKNETVK